MVEGFLQIIAKELEDSEGGVFHPIDLTRLHNQLMLMRCFKLSQLLDVSYMGLFCHIRLTSVNVSSSLHK